MLEVTEATTKEEVIIMPPRSTISQISPDNNIYANKYINFFSKIVFCSVLSDDRSIRWNRSFWINDYISEGVPVRRRVKMFSDYSKRRIILDFNGRAGNLGVLLAGILSCFYDGQSRVALRRVLRHCFHLNIPESYKWSGLRSYLKRTIGFAKNILAKKLQEIGIKNIDLYLPYVKMWSYKRQWVYNLAKFIVFLTRLGITVRLLYYRDRFVNEWRYRKSVKQVFKHLKREIKRVIDKEDFVKVALIPKFPVMRTCLRRRLNNGVCPADCEFYGKKHFEDYFKELENLIFN